MLDHQSNYISFLWWDMTPLMGTVYVGLFSVDDGGNNFKNLEVY